MKYLVVSDNHGDREVLVDLVAKRQGQVDGMFHCGDSELDANDSIWQNFVVVRGNCDYGDGFKNAQVTKIGTDTIYMTHGHLSNVRSSLTQLALEAEEVRANIALFGHTHELGTELIQGTLFLNPGSIRLPRGHYQIKTYAIIESDETCYQVTYYDWQHQAVEGLAFTFPK